MAFFHSIVQNFEKIAASFVQQDNFTSLNVTYNQTTFVAQKVVLHACSVINDLICLFNFDRFHWKPLLTKENVLQLKTMSKHQKTVQH